MKYVILIIAFTTIIFITGCSAAPPNIALSTNSYDLGDINPDGGVITETFFIKNIGDSPLIIESVSTSCGCTEAEVDSKEIPSGGQTKLIINYDPSVHPGLVGKIKRIVYIQSNDPLNKEVELELVGNSLPSSQPKEIDDHDEEYEGLLKDFEISPPALYKKIQAKETFKLLDVREDFEYEENHIKNTLLLSVNKISQEELNNIGLNKDDEIVVYCRSGRRSEQAYEQLHAMGYTNVKSLYGGIVHWMEDEYPVEIGAMQQIQIQENISQGTASIEFDRTEHDFGIIPQFGGIVNTTFTVINNGAADLQITSISTSCGCATAELEELTIPSGESTILTVYFDPDFHEEPEGRFSRTVFLETNDPNNPEAEITIFMDILEGE
jgi:rhodanese-related sulfurtransferase